MNGIQHATTRLVGLTVVGLGIGAAALGAMTVAAPHAHADTEGTIQGRCESYGGSYDTHTTGGAQYSHCHVQGHTVYYKNGSYTGAT